MYDHTLFLCLQIIRLDIWPHIKWAASLVIADGPFIFLMGLCEYILTLKVLVATIDALGHFETG